MPAVRLIALHRRFDSLLAANHHDLAWPFCLGRASKPTVCCVSPCTCQHTRICNRSTVLLVRFWTTQGERHAVHRLSYSSRTTVCRVQYPNIFLPSLCNHFLPDLILDTSALDTTTAGGCSRLSDVSSWSSCCRARLDSTATLYRPGMTGASSRSLETAARPPYLDMAARKS
jgi:hypothetical protein